MLLDLWGAQKLTDIAFIRDSLSRAAEECGATILDIRLHSFGEGGGITGVAILAESHISIHTWPELDYAALDIFMCGTCRAEDAIEPLKASFKPLSFKAVVVQRGENKTHIQA